MHDLDRSATVLSRSECHTTADSYLVYSAGPNDGLGEKQVPATMKLVPSYRFRYDVTYL